MDDPLKRKLAAILHADVVGYSRLTGEDEEGTYRLVRSGLDLFAESIQSHNGTVANYAGDTAVAMFESFNGGWDNCINELSAYLKELVNAG